MSITNELREWFKDRLFMGNGYAELTAIADRIDAEHERMLGDWDYWESTHVELPKDADGEYIHVEDRMEWVRYKDGDPTIVRTVSGIGNGVFFAWSDEQGRYAQYEAHAYRHCHAPTVEDVLREFADGWNFAEGIGKADSYIKNFAAKLRLVKEDA